MKASDGQLIGYEKEGSELWLWDDLPELHMEAGYRIDRLLHYERSPYQEISVAETAAFGRMLVLDGVPQVTEKDGYIYNEMITHLAMVTHPHPRHVAMIGGGDCGPAREAAKYTEVERIDVVEIDARVSEVCRLWLNRDPSERADSLTHLHHADGAKWIRKPPVPIDVLLIDRSDPYGPSAALYTKAFYKSVYDSLSADGITVFQSGSPFFDMKGLRITTQRLRSLFPVVRTYWTAIPSFPGGMWSFTLASKGTDPLLGCMDRLPTDTRYVNKAIIPAAFELPNFIQSALD
ncbi:polyamine aminopropyltransferase [Paenibacillus mendelii]|uniref:Polyamine aminopropyltransferase n=1 Tax=Paenibacillus mendelii TaxID=206163 RepID=A0ABV6JCY3_9BACL|nr:polyamine aminopropyltransferase [Paenibacillus mendelii]MCQ6562463.1 polyamine aminopropyltransferase [Paenibacillus mendelii]